MTAYLIISGIVPPDQKWEQMKTAYFACEGAGIPIPDEINDFFEHERPDSCGMVTYINEDRETAITEYSDENYSGYEIDISKLDPKFKKLRVVIG